MSAQATKIQCTLLAVIVSGLFLTSCSSGQPPVKSERESRSKIPEVAVAASKIAVNQVGVPYRYGGSSRSGFDCSGLVYYAYSQAGKSVPRTTAGLWRNSTPVSAGNLRVGDVLFFEIQGKMSHVGLYLGGGRFVHAPSSGQRVSIESLGSTYYRRAFVRGGRL